ncbi:MAG TPA: hypothetical protein VK698_19925 [Kofleriaceae bacterium]|nr:hypothetical protein [Kofleriaceae bacterium]
MAALAGAAALAACGGGAASSSSDLVKEVRGYNNGLRWRDFSASAMRVAPAARSDFLDRRDRLDEDLRIADWEMTRFEYDESRFRAVVQVEYRWLLDSRGIVHTTVARQFWARHGNTWLLDHEERLRGDPMPGVSEPTRVKPGRKGQTTPDGDKDNAGTEPTDKAPATL